MLSVLLSPALQRVRLARPIFTRALGVSSGHVARRSRWCRPGSESFTAATPFLTLALASVSFGAPGLGAAGWAARRRALDGLDVGRDRVDRVDGRRVGAGAAAGEVAGAVADERVVPSPPSAVSPSPPSSAPGAETSASSPP